jgi:integrase
VRNGRVRWYARWIDPDGRPRSKVFEKKKPADDFLDGILGDIHRGVYVDPEAGKVKFRAYADEWLAIQTFDRSTRETVQQRLEKHVYPVLGNHQLRAIKPSAIQAWQRGLGRLAASHRRVILVNVSTIFSAAVDDELIAKNPCRARSVTKPKVPAKKVTPWKLEQVLAVRSALVERYRVVATLGVGLGLRQGEIFGLSTDDIDWLRGSIEVQRQVKLFLNGKQAFALPKGGASGPDGRAAVGDARRQASDGEAGCVDQGAHRDQPKLLQSADLEACARRGRRREDARERLPRAAPLLRQRAPRRRRVDQGRQRVPGPL